MAGKSVQTRTPLFIEMRLEDLTNQFGPITTASGIVWRSEETEAGVMGGKTEVTFYISKQNIFFLM